jgi:hypothetical protein
MNVQTETLAARLYTTYCQAVGGKAFNGDPLPAWEVFVRDEWKQLQAEGWRAVAREAGSLIAAAGAGPAGPWDALP